ncbi:sensor histidine kinase [Nocardioides deserti]|uniref:histidine kinase n=1 Tax=Nocardioides deserti TaxID=1588644 RepID=A0ABR6U6R4_9ACTN|nr:HAMP domain-containing sensor histidine kinase [Nocardioides deserti]MBC2959995.1 HAMP domain-containing histidine kinase [Nocardioides deserti]
MSRANGVDRHAAGQVLLVLLLVGAPLPLALWLVPGYRDVEDAALAHELLVYPSVVVAGLLFYVAWRVCQEPPMGWFAAAVIFVGAQGLGTAAVRLARPASVASHLSWQAAIDIAVQVAIIVLIVLAARKVLPVDPLVSGLLAGIGVAALRAAVLHAPASWDSAALDVVLASVLFLAALFTALLLVRLRNTPSWVRARVATAVVVLAVSHLLVPQAQVTFPGSDVIAIALTVTGGVVLATTGFDVLQLALSRQRGALRGLREQVEHLEAGVRVDRARLHEINATLAGIAHASRLLHEGTLPAQSRRRDLERMVDLEVARLQRLLSDRQVGPVEEVDVDQLVEPLVVAHRSRGRAVHWSPTGLRAWCRPDDLAAVVNILLENAAQHAGTDTRLDLSRRGDRVEVRVCDRGPGIDPATRARLFHWGSRGASSRGQGIGLNVAHRLMTEQAGSLDVESSSSAGTTFLVTVPAAGAHPPPPHHDADDRTAP